MASFGIWAKIALVAVFYAAAANFGLKFATINESVSPIWPATGVSMACVFYWGYRVWPGIFIGAVVAMLMRGEAFITLPVALCVGLGNTAEALLAGWFCRKFSQFARVGETPFDFVFFCAVGGGLCTMVSATTGLVAMRMIGLPPGVSSFDVFLTWWIGNGIGAITVTPMALAFLLPSHMVWTPRRVKEAVPLGGVFIFLTLVDFEFITVPLVEPLPLSFLLFPLLVWIALRFGSRAAGLSTLILNTFSIHATALDRGPFGSFVFPENLAYLQIFLASVALISYSLAYSAEQRLGAEQRADLAWQHVHLHVERSPLGVIEWDRDFRVSGWNPMAEKIFGWSRAEAAGRHAAFIIPEEHRALVDEIWKGLMGKGGGLRSTNQNLTRSGKKILCEWYNLPLLNEKGQPIGAVSLVDDVTEAKRAQGERQALEKKLLEAQKLESLGVLAGGIAHDFNNLLTGILGNASLAKAELGSGAAAQQSLDEIETSARRAADLCRQMLAYSGRGRFVVESVDLNRLIQDTLPLIKISLSKKAEIKTELSNPLPLIEADATQIRQVVMNLVINASDALGEQNGEIRISTGLVQATRDMLNAMQFGPEMDPGPYVYLEVQDNGEGMDDETLRRIFEPFFTTKFAGRGLGLAAVLGIVRGHRGAISASSWKGQGSRFRILWPYRQSVETLIHDTTEECPEDWQGHGPILLVDDEDTVRITVKRMLEAMGYQVLLAHDGSEGLRAFERNHRELRLVLLDLTMPVMDGTQTFASMKAKDPQVPILLMSGYNEQEAVRRLGNTSVAGFVQKPFEMSSLREKVRMLARKE